MDGLRDKGKAVALLLNICQQITSERLAREKARSGSSAEFASEEWQDRCRAFAVEQRQGWQGQEAISR
jgi:hypothetical protein